MSQYETAQAALSYVLHARSFFPFLATPAVYVSARLHFFVNYLQTNLGGYVTGDSWRALVNCERWALEK